MNAFGNKLKLLRQQHNLTQANLGEILGVTSSYISVLEKAKQNPSDELIDKIAEHFNKDSKELRRLRDETTDYPNVPLEEQSDYSTSVRTLADTLMMIEEDEREKITDRFLEEIDDTLLGLLRPYSFQELKNEVHKIRSLWINSAISIDDSDSEIDNPIVLYGSLQLGQGIFFSIEYNSQMMKLTLLANSFDNVKEFDSWMDHHHVSYRSEKLIPHLSEKQKVVHFVWFAPAASYPQRLQILKEHSVQFSDLAIYDTQLKWLLQPTDE